VLRPFIRDTRGNTAVFFALSLPMLVGFVGLGTETGYWYWKHRQLQEAADIAAYSGAIKLRDTGSRALAEETARGDAALHGYEQALGALEVHTPPSAGAFQNSRSVEVKITQTEPRFFSGLISNEPVIVRVRAVGTYSENATACALALDKTAPGAITVSGSADVTFAGCTVTSDSIADNSVVLGGSAKLTTPCLTAVGGIDIGATLDLTSCTHPKEYAPYVRDPYADLAPPSTAGTCKNVPNKATTLEPGRYCGGFTLSGNVTLQPGTYIIDGGTFKINANSNVTGNGVTFYMTGNADMQFNGTAHIDFGAPTTGTYKGMLFFGDRNNTNVTHKFNGTADSALKGTLYFAKQSIEILGDFTGSNGCTQIVSRTIKFSGNTSYSADCTGNGIEDIKFAGIVQVVE
jgi:Flp pilus assembly protein TadG